MRRETPGATFTLSDAAIEAIADRLAERLNERPGCALDKVVTDAFFASLKKELTRRRFWPTRRELQTAVFAWIEGWYNRRRLHSTLGYLSPADYEEKYTLTEGGRAQTPLAA